MVSKMGIAILLVILLLIAAVYDMRCRRIPNWLTFPAILVGTAYHTVSSGLNGLFFSLGGLVVGMAVLIIFYISGGMGAGDVKLMGAVGAFLGPKGVFFAFLFTAIIGGVLSILALIYKGYFTQTFNRYWFSLKGYFSARKLVYIPPFEKEKRFKLPYGVAIALGTVSFVIIEKIL